MDLTRKSKQNRDLFSLLSPLHARCYLGVCQSNISQSTIQTISALGSGEEGRGDWKRKRCEVTKEIMNKQATCRMLAAAALVDSLMWGHLHCHAIFICPLPLQANFQSLSCKGLYAVEWGRGRASLTMDTANLGRETVFLLLSSLYLWQIRATHMCN